MFYSNSNWTFIALNLPYSKGILRRNKTKTVNQFQYPGTEKSPSVVPLWGPESHDKTIASFPTFFKYAEMKPKQSMIIITP